jgi:hypothetical protein
MRYAIVTLLAMTSSVTTVAVAQDGGAHGPPKSPIVIAMPRPTTGPTTAPSKVALPRLLQPKLELASTAK